MSKQTAVEWLVTTLNEKIDYIPIEKWDMLRKIIQQAIEMEKEQIKNAFSNGYLCHSKTSEQYYNKTFKSE